MIELCSFCGKEHETGDGELTLNGIPLKECPWVPESIAGIYISKAGADIPLEPLEHYGVLEADTLE